MNTAYYAPRSMPALHRDLAKMTPQSRIISGGTDLVIHITGGRLQPDALLYMGGVPGIAVIKHAKGFVQVGAMATMNAVAKSPLLRGPLAALADAAGDVGSRQIRGLATIGGNIAGASPAGDLLPVLFLLDAQVRIAGPNGAVHTLPINEVVLGPGKTTLAPNEAITGFLLPLPKQKPASRSRFVKLGFRKSMTIARIGLCASLAVDDAGVVQTARVVVGAISLVPLRVIEAEKALCGSRLDAGTAQKVGNALAALILEVTPEMFDRDYKIGAALGVAEDLLCLFGAGT